MKKSDKAILPILISLLCGIGVAWFYEPFSPNLFPTRLWFFEFPPFSSLMLIRMTCVLLAGIFLGRMAKKYASQAESKSQRKFASIVIFLNAIILILPVLNLISVFTPRTIMGVVDYKIQIEERGYICVTESEIKNSWSREIDFDESTVVYEQGQKLDQHKEITSANSIEQGQVVEIRYIDNDTSIYGIKSLNITILVGQHRPYKNENCGNLLP